MKTSVVLFDAAGVLFPLNKVVGEELQQKFGLSAEQLRPFWTDGLYKQLTIGQITTGEFLDAFAEMFKLSSAEVTEDIFVSAFEKGLSPMPGVQELLGRLAETGVHVALLSDTVEMYADIRHQLGYYKYFEKFFFSYETGIRKPDPQAYLTVIEYYGVPAQEIFFVDDTQKNVDGAAAQGMRAVRFEGADKLEEVLRAEDILK